MTTLQTAERQAAELARRSVAAGCLLISDLDGYLRVRRQFRRRVEYLVDRIGEIPLRGERPQARVESPPPDRVDGPEDPDSLRRYLRQVGGRRKMEKDEEIRLARRLEFARRRFETTISRTRIPRQALRDVLGPEFSKTYLQDLALREEAGGRSGAVDGPRRQAIRKRAAELNALRAEFVERNLGLVVDIAFAYRTYGVPLMDLVQEGNGSLIRAVEKFDWRKGVRFQTYATFWVRQAIERAIACNRGIVRVPNYLQQKMRRLRREGVLPRRDREVSVWEVSRAFSVKREIAGHLLETERSHFSLDVAIDDDGETFASMLPDVSDGAGRDALEFNLLRRRITECLHELSELEREILRLRFGLDGSDCLTLEEVGQRMNVSRERIRQLQVRAIRKLQRPCLLQRLTGFV